MAISNKRLSNLDGGQPRSQHYPQIVCQSHACTVGRPLNKINGKLIMKVAAQSNHDRSIRHSHGVLLHRVRRRTPQLQKGHSERDLATRDQTRSPPDNNAAPVERTACANRRPVLAIPGRCRLAWSTWIHLPAVNLAGSRADPRRLINPKFTLIRLCKSAVRV